MNWEEIQIVFKKPFLKYIYNYGYEFYDYKSDRKLSIIVIREPYAEDISYTYTAGEAEDIYDLLTTGTTEEIQDFLEDIVQEDDISTLSQLAQRKII